MIYNSILIRFVKSDNSVWGTYTVKFINCFVVSYINDFMVVASAINVALLEPSASTI